MLLSRYIALSIFRMTVREIIDRYQHLYVSIRADVSWAYACFRRSINFRDLLLDDCVPYRTALWVRAKFHYAIMVADRPEAGRRPAASWNLAYHLARYASELAGLRPASNRSATRFDRFEQVRAISTCRDSSNLVADRFEAGRRPASSLLAS